MLCNVMWVIQCNAMQRNVMELFMYVMYVCNACNVM